MDGTMQDEAAQRVVQPHAEETPPISKAARKKLQKAEYKKQMKIEHAAKGHSQKLDDARAAGRRKR